MYKANISKRRYSGGSVWEEQASTDAIRWRERAVVAATVCTVALLLGPGIGLVNAVCGPAADATSALSWREQLHVAPEEALVRLMTALGLVLAARLVAGLLLALAARLPGRTGVRAARLSIYVTPPLARRFMHVIISVGLSSWTGAALAAPAMAATTPTATVVPTPVLAPPEAALQTWPDLGRPGMDLPTAVTPPMTNSAGRRSWPDLGRPGTDVPTSPAPKPTGSRKPADTRKSQPTSRSADHPDAPAPAGPNSASRSATTSPRAADVVVAPGDCLWTLAQRDLDIRTSTAPSPADVAAATEKWWRANRAVIGANPDRLVPGQQLSPPADIAQLSR